MPTLDMSVAEAPDAPSILRFGEFELDCHTPELRRAGQRVDLPLQPLRVLVLLAARRGQVVCSDEIARIVWGSRVVSWPDSLHVCIRQLRRAIGESADNPAIIQTVPRRGYRFLPDAVPVEPASGQAKRVSLVAIAAILLFGLAVGAGQYLAVEPSDPGFRSPVFEAYQAYEKGAYLLSRFPTGEWRLAERHFEDAVEADPDYAAAWVGLADTQVRIKKFESAESALEKARALAPRSPEFLRVLGDLYLFRDWALDKAERRYLQAIDADPESAKGYQHYSMVLAARGQMNLAIGQMERALAIEPVSTIINADLGWYYYLAGDYEKSITQCRAALDIEPSLYFPHFCLLDTYSQQGETAKAVEEARIVLAAWGGDPALLQGSSEETLALFWQQYLGLLEAHSRDDEVSPMGFAYAYAGLGNDSMTLHWLEIAYRQRVPGALFAAVNPAFEFLHGHREFQLLTHVDG